MRKRRADRELEKAQMEEEQALLSRERAYAENLESVGKEEEVRGRPLPGLEAPCSLRGLL